MCKHVRSKQSGNFLFAEKNLQGFEMGWCHYELTQGSSLGFVSPCRYFLGGGRNLLWIWAMTT